MNDKDTQPLFKCDVQLLQLLSSLFNRLNENDAAAEEYSLRNLISQKIIVVIYLNLRQLTQNNRYMQVSSQQVRSCVNLSGATMGAYSEMGCAGDFVKECVRALHKVWS